MAYTTGTAANNYDLLVQLKNWLTGTCGWTLLNFTDDAGAATSGPGSVVNLQGPGGGSTQEVFLNIRTVTNTALSCYSWEFNNALSYSSSALFTNQLGTCGSTFLNLWNSGMTYWFFANNRRVIVVAKTSTVYVSMYAGMFLPWANPSQFAFPLYCAGDWNQITPWTQQISGRRMMCDPAQGYVRSQLGIWLPLQNENLSSSTNDAARQDATGNWAKVWPWSAGGMYYSGISSDTRDSWDASGGASSTGGGLDGLVPTAQGEHFLWPSMIWHGAGPQLGVLDGVYCLGGVGLSSEAAVTIGSRNFLVFQNVHRNSGNDFFAVEEI